METAKIIDLLENYKIDELLYKLKNELYLEEIGKEAGAKQRYAAMKRYFKYTKNMKSSVIRMPCKVEYEGKFYYSFTDGYSLVFTSEGIGAIEEYDNRGGTYYKVESQMVIDGVEDTIDMRPIFAEASKLGYRYSKNELDTGKFTTAWNYKGNYFKMGILDQAFRIIDDNEPAIVYSKGYLNPIVFKTSIGFAMILPCSTFKAELKKIVSTKNLDKSSTAQLNEELAAVSH